MVINNESRCIVGDGDDHEHQLPMYPLPIVQREAIINPQEMLDQGAVYPMEGQPAIITDPKDPECQLQQNGIDLRVNEVQGVVTDAFTKFTLNKTHDERCDYFPIIQYPYCCFRHKYL